jgi:hypothetical protein
MAKVFLPLPSHDIERGELPFTLPLRGYGCV